MKMKTETKNQMQGYFKNLSEEIAGKRNIITGKKAVERIIEHGKVQNYLNEGYLIISEGKKYITFKKPKKFNGWLFIFLLLLGIIPGILYLIYYASQSDRSITIQKTK